MSKHVTISSTEAADRLAITGARNTIICSFGASPLEQMTTRQTSIQPLVSSVLRAYPDGQRLWPKAGRRVPEDHK
jgi:hypothetical protein